MKTKNRKRLSAAVIALLLVFAVGAAFAFAPGALTIGGAVGFEVDYVIWSDGGVNAPSAAVMPAATVIGGNNDTTVGLSSMRGRDFQHIWWDVLFAEAGSATLTAHPVNRSTIAADLAAGIVIVTEAGIAENAVAAGFGTWAGAGLFDAYPGMAAWHPDLASLGLAVTITEQPTIAIPARDAAGEYGHAGPVIATVVWDGEFAGLLTALPDFNSYDDNAVVRFAIVFNYTPVATP